MSPPEACVLIFFVTPCRYINSVSVWLSRLIPKPSTQNVTAKR